MPKRRNMDPLVEVELLLARKHAGLIPCVVAVHGT